MINKNISEKQNIVVVGQGYVGLVLGTCFAEIGYKVLGLDYDEVKIQDLNNGYCSIYEPGLSELIQNNRKAKRLFFSMDYVSAYQNADFIFICVGTPERNDGAADLQYVETCALQIAEYVKHDCIVILKSTVPVGTNSKIESLIRENLKNEITVDVVSNPEFLSQGSAIKDMFNNRIVIGTSDEQIKQKMISLYEPFGCPVISVSRESAELIKYASNNFLSLKISYINEIAILCELIGGDIQEVVSGMCLDERIGVHFLRAGIGYGGSCFEKDAKALCYIAKDNGYQLKTVEAGLKVNNDQKIRLITKAQQIMKLTDLKIAVLGLTFKPETNDIRNAPSLANYPRLLEGNNYIVAYDPVGISDFIQYYPAGDYENGKIGYANSVEEALADANICFIFTEWKEFKELEPDVFIRLMKRPIVFDGRNLFKRENMLESGVEYYSIGH